MRRLIERDVIIRAVAAGLALGALGLPYVTAHTHRPELLPLQMAFLTPTAIVLFLIAVAWTPLAGSGACFRVPRAGRDWLWIVPLLLAAAALRAFWLDPMVESVKSGFIPPTPAVWLRDAPWIAGFQPLVLVAAVYAFTARLTGRPSFSIAAVVVLSALASWNHWTAAAPLPQALFLLAAGFGAMLFAWIYHRAGWWGLCAAVLLMYMRFLPRYLGG